MAHLAHVAHHLVLSAQHVHVRASLQCLLHHLHGRRQLAKAMFELVDLVVQRLALHLADLLHAAQEVALALLQGRHVAPRGGAYFRHHGLRAVLDALRHGLGHLDRVLQGLHTGARVRQQLEGDVLGRLHGVLQVDEAVAEVVVHGTLPTDGLVARITVKAGHFVVVPLTEGRRPVRHGLDGRRAGLGLMWGVGEARRRPTARSVRRQAHYKVVFGESNPLVGAHTVVTEILVTVPALRARFTAFVARTAHPAGPAPTPGAAARPPDHPRPQLLPPQVGVLVLLRHDHVEDVVDEKPGGQAVEAGIVQRHIVLACGTAQGARAVATQGLLQAVPAERMQARQHFGVAVALVTEWTGILLAKLVRVCGHSRALGARGRRAVAYCRVVVVSSWLVWQSTFSSVSRSSLLPSCQSWQSSVLAASSSQGKLWNSYPPL